MLSRIWSSGPVGFLAGLVTIGLLCVGAILTISGAAEHDWLKLLIGIAAIAWNGGLLAFAARRRFAKPS